MARGFKGFNRKSEGFLPWERSFAYTGGMQSVVIPHTALYKLEVWGASGGGIGENPNIKGGGANGGYSIGYVKLHKGQTVYICVGGAGGQGGCHWQGSAPKYTVAGGYNGGGDAHWDGGSYGESRLTYPTYGGWGGGGGATHIALVSGTIASIGKTSFVDNGNGLIVAGGGAGHFEILDAGFASGGAGGGTNGGAGGTCHTSGDSTPISSYGGTQSGGYAFGLGIGGGGGGLYGGGYSSSGGYHGYVQYDDYDRRGQGFGIASGGGSGYVGGVPTITYHGKIYAPTMYVGSTSGNGKAKITLIK